MLIPGTTLGTYEIIELLGKGGMGEVYRARNTRLKREVAIKILPEEFSRERDRVSRFEREAEILASMSHPNIAGIYDLQEVNGSRLLALELVEGETLAEQIQRGPIPVDEALNIARSICEALEAANEKGIVHRDLKPANVKITPEGRVKVLDFGLAKAYERSATEEGHEGFSKSPTLSMAATQQGVILGTAAYMSPEQVKGRKVDSRTDIFAFGCVLYEMLTGKPAFDGDDIQEILGAVLKSEPDWTRVPKNTPSGIVRLLRLCLSKDVKRRRQTATDVRIDIEQALSEPMIGPAADARATPRARTAWIVSAVSTLVAAVLAIPVVWHLRESPPSRPVMRFTAELAEGVRA
jgi:serine/threonine protein kinase